VPLVSVLMPVYNRETMVGDAIRSIQNQTFHDWELLLLDDASTDKSLEVCRAFEAEDKRIRVLVNERNVGCGESRNRLVSHATGEYIAMQDSDDVSVPQRLAHEVEILESKPDIGLVGGLAAWIDLEDGNVIANFPPTLNRGEPYPQDRSDMVRLLYSGCEVAVPTCMFRRSLLAGTAEPFGKYRFVDDWYFFLQVAHQSLMWGIPEVLVKMGRGKNHTHLWTNYVAALKEAKKMTRDVYELYKDNPESPINYRQYRRSVAILLTMKGRRLGGWKGYFNLIESILWDPSYRNALKSFWRFSRAAFRKGKRLAIQALQRK